MNLKIGKKAFTLIELMIVVVILGVLMSTILPKLTGSQARARDAGRMADLSNISAGMQLYYDDKGGFPGTNGSGECLKGANYLDEYLQGGMPQESRDTLGFKAGGVTCTGSYFYLPVSKNGAQKEAYAVCADMENYNNANTLASDITGTIDKYDDLDTAVGSGSITVDTANNESIYCILKNN